MIDMKKAVLYIASFLLMISPLKAQEVVVPSFAPWVKKFTPTVVNISTTGEAREEDDLSDIENIRPDFFQKKDDDLALGSGFIISDDGYIITNMHVIKDATSIEVTTFDNEKYEATVVGKDEKTDIALIKIKPVKPLLPAQLGDSDALEVGDWILAIGNPFGLGGSVTAGIISAKSRDIASGPYDNFIQTDASINQGNSGGPMFELKTGKVIGINSAIFSTNGASMGIGFAIPVNSVKWVVEQLKTNGTAKRGWIGVKIKSNLSDTSNGVIITSITENSPAQKFGLAVGDMILKVNGSPINNSRSLSRMIAEMPAKGKANVEILRNGINMNKVLEVAEMPVFNGAKAATMPTLASKYSLALISVDAEMGNVGLRVMSVLSGSDAELNGLQIGDIITHIDKREIFMLEDAQDVINEAKMENNRPVLLKVMRGGDVHFVAVKLAGR